MADISITAANVVAGTNASTATGTAGETITAGQVVYKSATTSKFMKADGDSATAGATEPFGIALNGASLNQPLSVPKAGPPTIGATLPAGTAHYLGDDPGGICPLADLATGDDVVLIGLATTTAILDVDFQISGVTL